MKKKLKLQYQGSIPWLIFWLIVFFPVALVLLILSGGFELEGKVYALHYDGSKFWVGFWTIFCFPVAFLLVFLNGISVETPDSTTTISV